MTDDIEPGSLPGAPDDAQLPSPPISGSSAPPPPTAGAPAPPAPPAPPVPPAAPAPLVPPTPWASSGLPAPPPPTTVVAPRWRSLKGLTTSLTVFLALAGVGAVFGLVAYAMRIGALSDIIDHGLSVSRIHTTDDADDLVGAAAGILLFLSFVILVLIIVWSFRAAKNNEALGRLYPRLKPGWAIAGWLIPIANLVLPVLVLQDLWRGSEVSSPRGDPAWRGNRGSALIGWYWGFFVVSSLRYGVGRSKAHYLYVQELRELRTHDTIALIGMVATVVAAVLAIQVVRRIASRQEECLHAQQAAWAGGA